MINLRFLLTLCVSTLGSTNTWADSRSPLPAETIEKPPLFLGVGEQRVLNIPALQRFTIGAPLIRAVSPRSFENRKSTPLVIRALAEGITDLWIWKKDGSTEVRRVQIEKIQPDILSPALKKGLTHLTETEVVFSGMGVILRGILESEAEGVRVSALVRGFPKDVIDETQPSSTLRSLGRSKISEWLKSSSLSGRFEITERAEELWVLGTVERPSQALAIEKKLRSLYSLIRTEIETLPDGSPTVHFKVFLLEIKKSKFRTLGVNWPATVENAFHVTPTTITDGLGLDLAIQALEGQGNGRVLSSPELVVRAPGEAELFSGGELPIHVQTQYFSNVTWKTFGLMLKLKISHSTAEKVRLEISTEVSHLDTTLMQNKTPGLQANRMKTQIDARYGTPLFLSGLLQEGTRESARGLPLLYNIPILGTLFGSEDYIHERSEL
ncbi:MAG: hypothetical protein AABZ55_06155, partial [Bdellovibrionota bacterium]